MNAKTSKETSHNAPGNDDDVQSSAPQPAQPLPAVADVVIVGGGIAGLLTALQLTAPQSQAGSSGEPSQAALKVVVLEQRESWGGRLVLGGQRHAGAQAHDRGDPAAASDGAVPHVLPGSFPAALWGKAALHLAEVVSNSLGADERALFDDLLGRSAGVVGGVGADAAAEKGGSAFFREARGCFVVRKEMTPGPLLEKGPSECLTRQAALALAEILSHEHAGTLAELATWKALRKPLRDELRPFFETVAGDDFEDAPVSFLSEMLGRALGHGGRKQATIGGSAPVHDPLMGSLPMASLAAFLAQILRERRVTMVLGARVERCRWVPSAANGGRQSRADVADGSGPTTSRGVFKVPVVVAGMGLQEIETRSLVAALPVALALTVVPREWLTPAQSRFVTRVRPRSAVALEIAKPLDDPDFAQSVLAGAPLCRLLFPVERVQALGSAQGGLIFYASLDYEVSLQTPSVREVLSRIKRAFRRLFPHTELETFARLGASPSQGEIVRRDLGERLVLIPVAHSVPPAASEVSEAAVPGALGAASAAGLPGQPSGLFCFVGEHGAKPAAAFEGMAQTVHDACLRLLPALRL